MDRHIVKNRTDTIVVIAYIIWEFINLIIIKVLGSRLGPTNLEPQLKVMYLAIIVNTVVTAYFFVRYGVKIRSWDNFIALGLFMTCMADYFVTLILVKTPGFVLFCVVELIYAIYLKPSVKNVILRILIYVLALILIGRAGIMNFSNAVGLFNVTLVMVNVVCAWIKYYKTRHRYDLIFACGIAFFFACDFSILLRSLSTGTLQEIVAFLVWIFYVPSQVLIVLSYAIMQKKNMESDR